MQGFLKKESEIMIELIIVAVVQICLESLPVSSSGHEQLAMRLWGDAHGMMSSIPHFFDHFLHGPTIIILAIFFCAQWWPLLRRIVAALLHKKPSGHQKKLLHICGKLLLWVVCANGITALLYGVIKVWLKNSAALQSDGALLAGFAATAGMLGALFFVDKKPDQAKPLTLGNMLLLGLVQGVALMPGISRFACTFTSARLLGLRARRAFELSFALLFPLITAAFFGSGLPGLVKNDMRGEIFSFPFMLAMLGATVVSYFLFVLAHRLAIRRLLWVFLSVFGFSLYDFLAFATF